MENQTDQNQNPAGQSPLGGGAPPVSPPVQTPPVLKPKSKLPIIIIGIILFLLIAGSAAGFYVFKQQSLKSIAKPTPIPVVQKQTPTPTPDPTANWKTYTGDGFTFKYPESFDNANCPQNSGISALCSAKQDTGPEPLIYYISASKETVLPKQYKYLTSTINDFQVFKTTDALSRSGAESVYIKKSDNSYVYIFFTPYDQQKPFPNQEKFYAIFTQILSTFKFTKNGNPNPSALKVFDGKDFSFKYPSEYTLQENGNAITLLKTNNCTDCMKTKAIVINVLKDIGTQSFEESADADYKSRYNGKQLPRPLIYATIGSIKTIGIPIGIDQSGHYAVISNRLIMTDEEANANTYSTIIDELNQILSTFKFTK